MFGFWGGNVFDIKDARHDLVDVPSRPRSRLMNAYSGTKLATARIRLRSLSADGVQWVLQEHLPDHVELCVGSDTHILGGTLHLYTHTILRYSILCLSVVIVSQGGA